LFVGDNIGEVKVLAIEQRSVKVELHGVTKVLWL
jgi:sRNA-binding carbon storage regulator CsrA